MSAAAPFGVRAARLDDSVRPQDDLYRHVNGEWLATATIPEDRPLIGAFTDLRDASEAAVRSIVEDAANAANRTDLQRKIGDLYASFMDEEAIEAAGITPLSSSLASIAAIADVEELLTVMGRLDRAGSEGLFGYVVTNDAGHPERCLLHLSQGGLGLPDESYYREEQFTEIRAAYREHVGRMLTIAGVQDGDAAASRVLDLETSIAKCHWDKVTLRNPQKTYTLVSRAEALTALPALEPWLAAAGIDDPATVEMVFYTAPFFSRVAELLTEDRLPAWRKWLALRLISSSAPYLSRALVAEDFAFYGTKLSGTPSNKERWKRGVALVEGALGEAVGQVYVERHFPAAHKARMESLVARLVESYRRSISTLEWMSQETINQALDKLDRFTPKIGFPDVWRDYGSLVIDPQDLLGNRARTHEFELNRQLAKIGAPIDRDEWLMTPQTVNAYYNPRMNEIVFPAAILQPPFFDADADDAVNFGAIGAVIGHEIGHGFDDQGSQFDGTGALRNWWTEADRTAFEKLTSALVDQYSALSPDAAPGSFVNGQLTLGENIGDLGGLAIAYQAYRLGLADNDEPQAVDGLSAAQRFFYAWAECWRTRIRPEEAVRRLATDPHSPAELRCNAVVRNLDAFHDAFGTTAADGLWLAPEQRVRIW